MVYPLIGVVREFSNKKKKKRNALQYLLRINIFDNGTKFRNFFRLLRDHFRCLLDLVSEGTTSKSKKLLQKISAFEKLSVAFREIGVIKSNGFFSNSEYKL